MTPAKRESSTLLRTQEKPARPRSPPPMWPTQSRPLLPTRSTRNGQPSQESSPSHPAKFGNPPKSPTTMNHSPSSPSSKNPAPEKTLPKVASHHSVPSHSAQWSPPKCEDNLSQSTPMATPKIRRQPQQIRRTGTPQRQPVPMLRPRIQTLVQRHSPPPKSQSQ